MRPQCTTPLPNYPEPEIELTAIYSPLNPLPALHIYPIVESNLSYSLPFDTLTAGRRIAVLILTVITHRSRSCWFGFA